MRRLYLTVQYQRLLRELFEDDVEAIRNPFRVLLSEEAIEHLLAAGAANGESYFRDRHSINRDRLSFVPGLGALRLHPKAQLEHRGIHHDYGNSCYPPVAFFSSPTGLRLVNRTEEMVSDSHLSTRMSRSRIGHSLGGWSGRELSMASCQLTKALGTSPSQLNLDAESPSPHVGPRGHLVLKELRSSLGPTFISIPMEQ